MTWFSIAAGGARCDEGKAGGVVAPYPASKSRATRTAGQMPMPYLQAAKGNQTHHGIPLATRATIRARWQGGSINTLPTR